MKNIKEVRLKVVIVNENGIWVSQCLDYDIAAQGESIRDSMEAFVQTVAAQILMDIKDEKTPLTDLPKAPEMYWDFYCNSQRMLSKRLPIRLPKNEARDCEEFLDTVADDIRIYSSAA